MQIPATQQIRDWDAYTIKHEPISSLELMERASRIYSEWFKRLSPDISKPVYIFCGPGNNGGDGLAIGRLLAQDHYEVQVFLCRIAPQLSEDTQANLDKLKGMRGMPLSEINEGDSLPEVPEGAVVIDALFGSGLNRPVEGYWANLIRHLNQLKATRFSVDIPSGLYADKVPEGSIFRADHTGTFQRPKLAFFLADSGQYTGEWEVLDIGLHPDFEKQIDNKYHYLTAVEIAGLLRSRDKFDHKGTFGHALLIAGSHGKVGAALLAAKACLRAGCGLISVHAPKCAYEILQIGFPEAMVECDSHKYVVSEIGNLSPYKSIGTGPGLGTNALTEHALKDLIDKAEVPLVLDADALNILAKNKTWLDELPAGSVLTPHPGEFRRLVGETANSFQELDALGAFAERHGVHVILKGAHSAIAAPSGEIWFNTSGNPGMGTGGSGDVLTGILTGLLAQGYHTLDASRLAVYLHGLAGDIAGEELQQESLLAGDIIDHLGQAFGNIRESAK
ncbi:MAG: NAD(P)H-hydrate dehydratase [Bacteroidetes bacterium]|nr:NAD(P)H-hydrate dehydratase [Bacteroidota bacterium]